MRVAGCKLAQRLNDAERDKFAAMVGVQTLLINKRDGSWEQGGIFGHPNYNRVWHGPLLAAEDYFSLTSATDVYLDIFHRWFKEEKIGHLVSRFDYVLVRSILVNASAGSKRASKWRCEIFV